MTVNNSRRTGHLCVWWPLVALVMVVILSLLLYALIAQQQASAALTEAQADAQAWQVERETLLQRLAEQGEPPVGTDFGPLWSQTGLEEQQRMVDYMAKVEFAGFNPATTTWQTTQRAVPAGLREAGESRYDSPGELLMALSQAWQIGHSLGTDLWETSWRVLLTNEQSAVGIILLWGWMDDAVVGTDYRVILTDSAGGWVINAVEERHHCRRGVEGDCQCCV